MQLTLLPSAAAQAAGAAEITAVGAQSLATNTWYHVAVEITPLPEGSLALKPLVTFYVNEALDKQVFAPAGWINENYMDHQREVSIGGPHPVHGLGRSGGATSTTSASATLRFPSRALWRCWPAGWSLCLVIMWRKRS